MKTETLECCQKWYDNGQLLSEEYWLNGEELHNENGPAFRGWHKNGQPWVEEYRLNNKFHNENGPAYRSWHKNGQPRLEEYRLNGELHNENGPAFRGWHKNGQPWVEEYWLNGEKLTKEQWQSRVNLNRCDPEGQTIVINGQTYRLQKS